MDDEQANRVRALEMALARMQRRNDFDWGRLAEKFAKTLGRKVRVPSESGRASFRIPDLLTAEELIEVKNVRRLFLTAQLRDFLAFCEMTDRQFVICVRGDVRLSRPLQDLVDSGAVRLRELAWVFSDAGQAKLSAALRPTINKAFSKLNSGASPSNDASM